MKVRDLIEQLEGHDPDAIVLVSNRDYADTYRAPVLNRTIWTEERSPDVWRDVSDKERDRDQLGVVL